MSHSTSGLPRIAVLGAGLTGCSAAARLAQFGLPSVLYDQASAPMTGASLNNEGKLHLGYVYAADPTGISWHVMANAAIRFERDVDALFRVAPAAFIRSDPFVYTVSADSALPAAAIAAHLGEVDRYLATAGADLPPCQPLPDDRLAASYDTDRVAAVFTTPELAIHTTALAGRVRTALDRTSEITVRTASRVMSAGRGRDGQFEVETEQAGVVERTSYDLVINALWDDRLRVDETAGFEAPGPNIMRYKASILFDNVPASILADLPTTTLVSGAFGDLVKRGDGGVYLSWYPVCKLGQTLSTDARELRELAEATPPAALITDSIDGLARHIPAAKALHALAGSARVGGGVIVARGQSDISDRSSALHARGDIGPTRHGHWISVDTGKFTTAPAFGLAAADLAREALCE